ncbi:helix-turn-helix domain-containing protein [Luteolibacter sp. GHJ8]|uniref:Helix-turn-helix domain-containing protein n=1 Tax=Luteolibacter rhizosphaerae TaxID=2989719 RepID=A0ABT3FZL5_9BACT|nr:helix-turn-helix domain-containing protein [Luteolibacter rhizosphaerae]MCW1913017.1 helix-turn-helix domain-containing protein [Luteolibacter rhizosphaerae]
MASNTEAGAKRAKALELAGEGLSQARIARELGVSAATVSRWLGKGSKAA